VENDDAADDRSARQVGVADGNVILDLFVLHQRIGALLDKALDGTGVRPAEFAVYSQLGIDTMTPRELTARLGVTASTLTGHLAAIERRGDIRRLTDTQDRRSHRLRLTDSGQRRLARCRERFRLALTSLEAEIGVDVNAVRHHLREVDRAADQVTRRLAGEIG
jgi:DNA-binding MarR family transcriptional regulator